MNFVILRRTDLEAEIFEINNTFNQALKFGQHICFEKVVKRLESGVWVKARNVEAKFFIPSTKNQTLSEEFLKNVISKSDALFESYDEINFLIHFGGDPSQTQRKAEEIENYLRENISFLNGKDLKVYSISFGTLDKDFIEGLKNKPCLERIKELLKQWIGQTKEEKKEEIKEISNLEQFVNEEILKNIEKLENKIKDLKEISIDKNNVDKALKAIVKDFKEIVKTHSKIYQKLVEYILANINKR